MTTATHTSNHGLLITNCSSRTIVVPAPHGSLRRDEKLFSIGCKRDAMVDRSIRDELFLRFDAHVCAPIVGELDVADAISGLFSCEKVALVIKDDTTGTYQRD